MTTALLEDLDILKDGYKAADDAAQRLIVARKRLEKKHQSLQDEECKVFKRHTFVVNSLRRMEDVEFGKAMCNKDIAMVRAQFGKDAERKVRERVVFVLRNGSAEYQKLYAEATALQKQLVKFPRQLAVAHGKAQEVGEIAKIALRNAGSILLEIRELERA